MNALLVKKECRGQSSLMECNNENRITIYLYKVEPCSQAEISSFARTKVLPLAARDLKLSENSIVLKTGTYGKPHIAGTDKWHFNITHTTGMIGIAVSDKPIGIDAEKIQDADLRIARRFFTERENLYIDNAPDKKSVFSRSGQKGKRILNSPETVSACLSNRLMYLT